MTTAPTKERCAKGLAFFKGICHLWHSPRTGRLTIRGLREDAAAISGQAWEV